MFSGGEARLLPRPDSEKFALSIARRLIEREVPGEERKRGLSCSLRRQELGLLDALLLSSELNYFGSD